jgi:hypothetical protein
MSRSRPSASLPRVRRRATLYVAVLGVALVVSVIGISALVAVQLANRSADLLESAARADFYAQAYVDLTLNKLVNTTNWRTIYEHNVWTADQVVGEVTYSFRLADEADGDLADDANEPVRLYAKAAVRGAVRIYSVQVAPTASRNLLLNGDMEDGTANWYGLNCTVAADTTDAHGGATALLVSNRSNSSAGPGQSITSVVENGAAYSIKFWAKFASVARNMRPRIEITASGSGTQNFDGGNTLIGSTWGEATATITPTWTGTLTSANFYVVTSFTTASFRLDDVSLRKQSSTPALVIVPGTWRRELAGPALVEGKVAVK